MKRQIAPLLTVIMLCSLVSIPSVGSFFVFPQSTFMLADDWNQIGNATLDLDTPEWNQVGNASLRLDMPQPPAPYSINSFSETSDDDFWITADKDQFQPDYGHVLGQDPSVTETNTWAEGIDDDGTYWQVAGDGGLGLQFYVSLPELQIGHILKIGADWKCQDDAEWYITVPEITDIPAAGTIVYESSGSEGYVFRSVTFTVTSTIIGYQNATGYLAFSLCQNSDSAYVHCDNFVVEVSSAEFSDSFYDVTDWVVTQGTMITNRDVANITRLTGSYAYAKYTLPEIMDFTGYYYEYYVSAGTERHVMQLRDSAGLTVFDPGWITGTGVRRSFIADGGNVSQIWIFVDDTQAYGSEWVCFDYALVYRPELSGWQHDCSILEGVTSGASVSTDGDKITATATGAVQATYWKVDPTTTESGMTSAYFPFMEISITGVTDDGDGNCWLGRVYDTASNYQNFADYNNQTGILRYNLESLTTLNGYPKQVRIYLQDATDSITIEYIKFYNIANYSYSDTSPELGDVLYTADNVLISSMGAVGTITLNQDPAVNITTKYRSYEMNPSSDLPEVSFYHSAWTDFDDSPTGFFPTGRIITDIKFKFAGDLSLENITFLFTAHWIDAGMAEMFIDTPEWIDVAEAIIRLFVPIPETFLQLVFVIIGAVLIPTSTVFLAYGGRKNLSMDKMLLFLIIFFIGWALLLGAIM